jgi:hypothetical protein
MTCTVCDCTDAETRRARHNYETCRNMTPHPMVPLGDTGKFYCPEHDR